MIIFVKKSMKFQLLFEQISQRGVDHTTLLQNIVIRTVESGDYHRHNGNTFIELEVQEEMETASEHGGPNHVLEIEYKCSQFRLQYAPPPYVAGFTLVCITVACHS